MTWMCQARFWIHSKRSICTANISTSLSTSEKSGVVPGNRLTVLDRGDPSRDYREEDMDVALEDFPWEHKGMLMVVESYDDHALAVIIGSIQAMENGSLVRMFQELQ